MKVLIAIIFSLVAVNMWDDAYNHGAMTRAGFALANELARAFGLA